MKTINNAVNLQEARSHPRAFVFFYVTWAIQARHSMVAVQKLLEAWRAVHPDIPAESCVADLSDQTGEVWDSIRIWLHTEQQPVDLLTFGGNGALLWVQTGTIVAHCPNAGIIEHSNLLAMTAGAFGPPETTQLMTQLA